MSAAPSHAASLRTRIRRHPVLVWIGAIVLLLLVIAAVALQGALLREPLERFLTEKTGHPVTIGALEAGIQHGFELADLHRVAGLLREHALERRDASDDRMPSHAVAEGWGLGSRCGHG